MPLYDYRCINCGAEWTEFRKMSDACDHSTSGRRGEGCPQVAFGQPHVGKRVYSPRNVFRFTEDRLRMWKGPMGNGFSTALGCQMPDNRADLARLEKEKGVEFVSPGSMPGEWQEAVEYRKHVDEGGERLEDPARFSDVPAFNAGDTRPEYMKEGR